jgi:hypothetical protein
MKANRWMLSGSAMLLLSLAAVYDTTALERSGVPPAEKPDAAVIEENTSYRGKITSVDANSKSVTVEDEKLGSQKLHVDESTRLTKGGNKNAQWEDLQVGVAVQGSFKKMGAQCVAESIAIIAGADAP